MTAAPERESGSLGHLARSGSLNVVGAGVGGLLTVVVTWQVVNGASTSVAGSLFAATSVFMIVVALAELGSDVSLGRFIPRNLARGIRDETILCIWAATLATLVASMLGAAAVIAWRHDLADLIATDAEAEATSRALVYLALGIAPAAVMSTLLSATRGFATVRPTVLLEKVGRGTLQVALTAAVIAAGGGIAGLSVAWVAPYLLGALATVIWLVPVARRALPDGDVERMASGHVLREYASFTWPRAVARLCQMILQRADIIVIAVLRSPAEAAVYTVATRFLVVGQLSTLAIQQVVGPLSSRLLATGDSSTAAQVYQTTTAWSMALTWPLYLLTLGGAPVLLHLFGGAEYTSGATVVVILSLAALVATACGPVDTILLMSGSSRLSLGNNVAALVVDLSVLLAFVPRFGMVAAAIGWGGAVVVKNALAVWQVRRLQGWYPFSRSAAVVAGISAAAFGAPSLVMAVMGVDDYTVVVAVLLGGTAAYCALLYRFRTALSLRAFAALLPGRRRRVPAGMTTG